MDSPWRRTLASVFLLLSQHNVRVLCQNVVPSGPMPLLREPMRDSGIITGSVSQRNLLPGPPNGFPREWVPPEYPYFQDYIGSAFPQSNIGTTTQGPVFNLPQLNNLLPQQGAIFNLPPTIVPPPQGNPLNIPHTPLLPIPQGPNCEIIPPSANTLPQCLQSPNIHLVPITQEQIMPGSCTETTDLSAVHFLPPPIQPSSIPIQNYAHIIQTPIRSIYPQSIVPVDVMPNKVLPNNQSAAPPFYPDKPLLYADSFVDQSTAEEYTPVPINLHINVSPPTIPEPKITIITAIPPALAPPAPVTTSDSSDITNGFYPPFPLPPIIIEGRRSRSKFRSWLPLFLLALFARDDNYGGFGGGSGGCCCCFDSGAIIPVPYPIPIPTNNPIILGNKCCSRKRENKSTTKKKPE